MTGTYPEYLLLQKGATPPADPHATGVRVYADSDGALRSIQSDGTDAAIGGGGGSTPTTGFAVHENLGYEINNSARWVPDTLDFASDDWDTSDSGNGRFEVGAGAGGLYAVECGLIYEILTGGPADAVYADIVINATAWNVDPISFDLLNVPIALSADSWRGQGSAMLPLSDGCIISVEISRHPFSGLTAQVAYGSFLRAFRIGEDPSFL